MSACIFRPGPAPLLPLFDVHINLRPPGAAPDRVDGVSNEDLPGLGVSEGCIAWPCTADAAEAHERLRTEAASRWRSFALVSRIRPRRQAGDPLPALDGFAGVKLMLREGRPPDAGTRRELARRRLPVLVPSGASCPPAWLERTLLPDLDGPLILGHLGSWPCAAEHLEDAVELAKRHSRVFLETSGASIGNFIAHAAERVPDKVLFGSNAPMCPPRIQWAHVAAAIRDDRTLERVAGGNARRLFG